MEWGSFTNNHFKFTQVMVQFYYFLSHYKPNKYLKSVLVCVWHRQKAISEFIGKYGKSQNNVQCYKLSWKFKTKLQWSITLSLQKRHCQKAIHTKCWWRLWRTDTFYNCCQECRLIQTLWKTAWIKNKFTKKLKLLYGSAIRVLSICPKELKSVW